jgi:hypothetical protein
MKIILQYDLVPRRSALPQFGGARTQSTVIEPDKQTKDGFLKTITWRARCCCPVQWFQVRTHDLNASPSAAPFRMTNS